MVYFLSEGVTESEVDDTKEDDVSDEDEDDETHARIIRSTSNIIQDETIFLLEYFTFSCIRYSYGQGE